MNSVFASVIAVSLVMSLSHTAADEPYRMPEVYVSASRIAGDLETSGRNVVVLDRQEIERRAATSIADLLGGLPGVDARSRGPFGVQTDLEVAGATFSQVLVLVDGVRVNDPQTGHHNLNLPLEPNDLERVEIVYGGGSAIHGPDAFGAVINLVPREVLGTSVDIAGHLGESLDDEGGAGSDVTVRRGWSGDRGSLWIGAGRRWSNGYRINTQFDVNRVFLRGSTSAASGTLTVQAGLQDKEFGAQDFYGAPSKEWTKVWLYSAQFRRAPGSARSVVARAFHRRHRDRFVLLVDDPAFYENRHLSERAGFEGSATVVSGSWGTLLAGGELARESIDSRNLNSPRFSGLGEHGRWRSALFSEYRGWLGAGVGFGAGLRFDRHEVFGWETSPSIGLSYPWRQHRLFASAARAYRAPSFTEFYYEDTRNRGNPDLAAESGWYYETGIETAALRGARLRSSLFARYENDLVDYVRTDTTQQWVATNLGEMRSVGVQLHGDRSWGPRFRSQVDYMWIDKEQTLSPGTLSKYVFTHPTHQLTLRLDHTLLAGISAGWQAQMKQRTGQDDYTLVDVVISRSFGFGRSLLRVQNLTDKRYEAVGGVPMPGRWLSLETEFEL